MEKYHFMIKNLRINSCTIIPGILRCPAAKATKRARLSKGGHVDLALLG